MTTREVYEKYKHIRILDDEKIMTDADNNIFHACYEMWQSIKEQIAKEDALLYP